MAALQKLFGLSCPHPLVSWAEIPGMPHQGGTSPMVVLGKSDPRAQGSQVPCVPHRVHIAPSLGSPAFSAGFSAVGLVAELSGPTGYSPDAAILLGDFGQTPKLL